MKYLNVFLFFNFILHFPMWDCFHFRECNHLEIPAKTITATETNFFVRFFSDTETLNVNFIRKYNIPRLRKIKIKARKNSNAFRTKSLVRVLIVCVVYLSTIYGHYIRAVAFPAGIRIERIQPVKWGSLPFQFRKLSQMWAIICYNICVVSIRSSWCCWWSRWLNVDLSLL